MGSCEVYNWNIFCIPCGTHSRNGIPDSIILDVYKCNCGVIHQRETDMCMIDGEQVCFCCYNPDAWDDLYE